MFLVGRAASSGSGSNLEFKCDSLGFVLLVFRKFQRDKWENWLNRRVGLVILRSLDETHPAFLIFFLEYLEGLLPVHGNLDALDEVSKWWNGVKLAAIECYKFIMHYAEVRAFLDNS